MSVHFYCSGLTVNTKLQVDQSYMQYWSETLDKWNNQFKNIHCINLFPLPPACTAFPGSHSRRPLPASTKTAIADFWHHAP